MMKKVTTQKAHSENQRHECYRFPFGHIFRYVKKKHHFSIFIGHTFRYLTESAFCNLLFLKVTEQMSDSF